MNFPRKIAKRFMLGGKGAGPSRLTGWIAITGFAVGCMAMVLSISVLNGVEFRINGSSFYSFPFALSYEYHIPLFDDSEKVGKHYIKLLFDFISFMSWNIFFLVYYLTILPKS